MKNKYFCIVFFIFPSLLFSQEKDEKSAVKVSIPLDTTIINRRDSICNEQPDSVWEQAHVVAEKIIEDAHKFLGTPYIYGANGPKAFDCSAFTRFLYKNFGYKLARSAKGQSKDGRPVEGDISDLQKGDILIFGSRKDVTSVGHVGIFMELDSTKKSFSFIHAAHGGVKITELKDSYYKQRFLGARRILPDFIRATLPIVGDTLSVDTTKTLIIRDTLALQETDQRIILFGNGKWAQIDESGRLRMPKGDNKILLSGDGTWISIDGSKVKIPILTEEEGSSTKENASDSLYHTIRKGDNLSKIAAKYHTSVSTLCRLNGIETSIVLREGKIIKIK